MTEKYDVMFIGSGHATWHGALKLAQKGKKVALIEGDKIFGTCTNYGCNAKFLLDRPADVVHQVENTTGLKGEVKIDWPTLMDHKHKMLDSDPDHKAIRESFPKLGIDIIDGWGSIKDQNHVQVGEDIYETDYIVIGTGLRPSKLNIEGQEYLHDSRDFLSMPTMPKHITFIGTGIISYEFADLSRAAGAEVEVIGHSDQPLRNFYPKYVKKLTKRMKKNGINFDFNQNVDSITKTDKGLVLKTKEGLEVNTDYVLDATGRVANYENLGLDKLNITAGPKGIKVDDHLRTSVKNIFVSGDAIDKKEPKLTPTATFESNYIAKDILNDDNPAIKYPPIAEALFSLPRLAQVGLKVQDVKDNDDYEIKRVPYGMLVFEPADKNTSEATIILNKEHQIVGATILGGQSVQIANALSIIISKKMTPEEVDEAAIMAFPDDIYGIVQLLTGALPG
ncbi:dihydrolipoyl dehydrogenase family protein [Apilactobacillus timberlakei]|uniref:NAD(P)/FAD-dependent oxidoreductase n=1 Tax=Apilactobacillus timberlakei TaxID=2008380 RepID=A0ABY2YT49_9LACO|nr:NAD(P)/FAD-dependent oxidoreductase [Apilactobacillus timberlakei]TPR14266.1 NAD(P)/FAD-dependent oxidoreductase [Apilactobacillus timberlakei]TPR16519.1 NAD(P)/FAD-dependent oxidoreductase [Apilactobacillus timberlakei]